MSSTLATVKEGVKETLIGSEEQDQEQQLSAQTKATFDANARKDGETGELVMGVEEFISAIAPEDEDYVSHEISKSQPPCRRTESELASWPSSKNIGES